MSFNFNINNIFISAKIRKLWALLYPQIKKLWVEN